MTWLRSSPARLATDLRLSAQALQGWEPRRFGLAALFALGTALLIGIPTVIIPNPIFGRDIPVVAWNYPVWLLTSLLTGMLIATYVRARPAVPQAVTAEPGATRDEDPSPAAERSGDSPSRLGMAGGVLTWFAVGCPVCNKIALLALGYSGALTWFAPFQPVLAVLALGLVAVALVARLRGQVACPLPARSAVSAAR